MIHVESIIITTVVVIIIEVIVELHTAITIWETTWIWKIQIQILAVILETVDGQLTIDKLTGTMKVILRIATVTIIRIQQTIISITTIYLIKKMTMMTSTPSVNIIEDTRKTKSTTKEITIIEIIMAASITSVSLTIAMTMISS